MNVKASERKCSIEGCINRGYTKRTWCNTHYRRWRIHGDPLTVLVTQYPTPEKAFAARTERQGDCLVWNGNLSKGYGQIFVGGRKTAAHRYSYEHNIGPIPEGMELDHMCHNKACCEPSHLRPTTRKQNLENRAGITKAHGSSLHRGVYWEKRTDRWYVQITHAGTRYSGGAYAVYELHVAAYYARLLRNKHFTHNDLDRREPIDVS